MEHPEFQLLVVAIDLVVERYEQQQRKFQQLVVNMNRAVRAWQRHQGRPKYEGPDAVTMGGETYILPMEEKKVEKIQKHLPKQDFNNIIRLIKRAAVPRANTVGTATGAAMERLGVKRNLNKAVKGVPDGSDQGNVRVIIEWLDKIQPGDRKAIRQVMAIDATAAKRVEV